MQNKNDKNTYFENMSRAFADLCDNYATVMTEDPHNIPLNGIWGKIEFPELQKTGNPGGQVNSVSESSSVLRCDTILAVSTMSSFC